MFAKICTVYKGEKNSLGSLVFASGCQSNLNDVL